MADKELLAKKVGQRLKELRKAKTHLGQKEVSKALGITKQALSSYESGRHLPDIGVLVDLATYYSCSIDYLFGREEKVNHTSTNTSSKDSVNILLSSLDKVADDEGDYLLQCLADVIESLAISNGNPQRKTFIECIGEFLTYLTEYIEASKIIGNHLSKLSVDGNLDAEKVAVGLARISGFDDISKTIDDIRRAGVSAVISFSVEAKKALRIRTGWNISNKVNHNAKSKEFAKKLIELIEREE